MSLWRWSSLVAVDYSRAGGPGKSCSLSLNVVSWQKFHSFREGQAFSMKAFSGVDGAHPHDGGQSGLFNIY